MQNLNWKPACCGVCGTTEPDLQEVEVVLSGRGKKIIACNYCIHFVEKVMELQPKAFVFCGDTPEMFRCLFCNRLRSKNSMATIVSLDGRDVYYICNTCKFNGKLVLELLGMLTKI